MKILKVALAQISPVWLNKNKTLDKVKTAMLQASKEKAELVVFGEGLLPGYPFWLALTNGAQWDLKINKVLHAHYVQNSINIENGDLDEVCSLANQYKMAVYIGVIERASNRGTLIGRLPTCLGSRHIGPRASISGTCLDFRHVQARASISGTCLFCDPCLFL